MEETAAHFFATCIAAKGIYLDSELITFAIVGQIVITHVPSYRRWTRIYNSFRQPIKCEPRLWYFFHTPSWLRWKWSWREGSSQKALFCGEGSEPMKIRLPSWEARSSVSRPASKIVQHNLVTAVDMTILSTIQGPCWGLPVKWEDKRQIHIIFALKVAFRAALKAQTRARSREAALHSIRSSPVTEW